MTLSSWLSWPHLGSQDRHGQRRSSVSRPKKARLVLEPLEDRALLASFTASSVSDLIADINLANTAGGTNTITLTAPTTSPYALTDANKTSFGPGPDGLPFIAAEDNLTIVGNGDTIERSTGLTFRLLEVASGGSLTLENLTLQGGLEASGVAKGGAILNQGALTLSGVTVANNHVDGAPLSFLFGGPGPATGGAIWSNGSLTLENGTLLTNNTAIGASGWDIAFPPWPPGAACGGAVYVAGGTASITNTTFMGNRAIGGQPTTGRIAGNAFGGALYVAAGQVILTTSSVNNNFATSQPGRAGGVPGSGYGGGVYVAGGTVTLASDTAEINHVIVAPGITGYGGGLFIAQGATVYIDAFTLANLINNFAGTDPNIDGTYIKT